jgi:hypothetical protein
MYRLVFAKNYSLKNALERKLSEHFKIVNKFLFHCIL